MAVGQGLWGEVVGLLGERFDGRDALRPSSLSGSSSASSASISSKSSLEVEEKEASSDEVRCHEDGIFSFFLSFFFWT